ncbi:MAG: recombination regulator RecX [Firmicutes bacterium]|nr:recombination regulator RecX [Bacillota bacterium]
MNWNKPARAGVLPADKVYAAALHLLGMRDYSEAELLSKLLAKGAGESDAAETIERLKELGYLDEKRLAAAVIRHYQQYQYGGRLYVRQKLRQKGVKEEHIASAMEQYYDRQTEREVLARAVAKERDKLPADLSREQYAKEIQRIARRLSRRGFSVSEIFHLLQNDI